MQVRGTNPTLTSHMKQTVTGKVNTRPAPKFTKAGKASKGGRCK